MKRTTLNLMEDQLTIRFPRGLSRALRERAARMERKPSEVVQMAVREFLAVTAADGRHRANRVKDLIGSLESGVPDLADYRMHGPKPFRRVPEV